MVNPVCVLREEFDDWAVLFNPDTGDALGISPVGVLVWKLLDRSSEVGEIVARIRESFDDIPEGVESEIEAFVKRLADRGFVGYDVTGVHS
jgi:SynChlorMet cassette protein ScmD